MSVEGFPNMLMLLGPHTALGNIPRSIEYNVEWVSNLLRHMQVPQRDIGDRRIEDGERQRLGATDHDPPLGLLRNLPARDMAMTECDDRLTGLAFRAANSSASW